MIVKHILGEPYITSCQQTFYLKILYHFLVGNSSQHSLHFIQNFRMIPDISGRKNSISYTFFYRTLKSINERKKV